MLKQACLALAAAGLVCLPAAWADKYCDEGIKLFQKKDYKKAIGYFEQAIGETPWETKPYYYSALSYHYLGDYKKAAVKYAAIIERFPGTPASQNATQALKALNPGYFRQNPTAGGSAGAAPASASSASENTGNSTIEGSQTRVYFNKSGRDMIVDARVNGRGIKVVFDPAAEHTSFSRGQLQALAVPVQAGSKEQRIDLQLGQLTRKNFEVKVDEATGGQPRLGQSFIGAFAYQVDNGGNWIDLQRKSGSSAGSLGKNDVPFVRSGKDILVAVEINGRSLTAAFDPNADGIIIPQKLAKSVGLAADEAEEVKPLPSEGPQRGEAGWVSQDERQSGPKQLVVRRLKFGPVEKSNVTVQLVDSASRYAKIGADFVSTWRYDVDYSVNVIHFNRR
ncbi:MAG: hypothetical protein K2W82_12155 [Candidatus Obscuribacterales bacterium]|jgi:hypothetical protein|nr:hypothetical protein [Candidatus Obscuribacterales bacterium]